MSEFPSGGAWCCSCFTPSSDGSGYRFQFEVVVEDVPTRFSSAYWSYQAPVITSIAPDTLWPQPDNTTAFVTITGVNFGSVFGTVTASSRPLQCSNWSDASIVCYTPRGVARDVVVVVTAASTLQSRPSSDLHYLPPVILAASSTVTPFPTRGGSTLTVFGETFAPPLPVTVWLSRSGATPSYPWTSTVNRDRQLLQCPVLTANVTTITCAVPPGSGMGWAVLVVNHDTDVTVSSPSPSPSSPQSSLSALLWQSSLPSSFRLSYAAPVVTSVSALAAVPPDLSAVHDSAAHPSVAKPARGGFAVLVTGVNFGVLMPTVSISSAACSVVGRLYSDGAVVCLAPPRVLSSTAGQLTVVQDGQASDGTAFVYDAPIVTAAALAKGVVQTNVSVAWVCGVNITRCVSGCHNGGRADRWVANCVQCLPCGVAYVSMAQYCLCEHLALVCASVSGWGRAGCR